MPAGRRCNVAYNYMRCAVPRGVQSVKLSVLEDRVLRMAALTKQLPTMLAREGKVKIRWGGVGVGKGGG